MNIPSIYLPGYKKACACDSELADRYIEHTLIGDPEADALIESMFSLEPNKTNALFRRALGNPSESELRTMPPLLRDFCKGLEAVPGWVDLSAFNPGIRMFHRNSRLTLMVLLVASLVENSSTNISQAFFITGKIRDQGVRR